VHDRPPAMQSVHRSMLQTASVGTSSTTATGRRWPPQCGTSKATSASSQNRSTRKPGCVHTACRTPRSTRLRELRAVRTRLSTLTVCRPTTRVGGSLQLWLPPGGACSRSSPGSTVRARFTR
jgi:hypothetical protein